MSDENKTEKQVAYIIDGASRMTGFGIGLPLNVPVVVFGVSVIYARSSLEYGAYYLTYGCNFVNNVYNNMPWVVKYNEGMKKHTFVKGDSVQITSDRYGFINKGDIGTIVYVDIGDDDRTYKVDFDGNEYWAHRTDLIKTEKKNKR